MQMAWWRFIFLGLSGFSALTATAGLADTHLRIPVRDDVYLQEIGRKVAAPFSLTSVAVYEGKVYAGSSAGLHQLNGENWAPVSAVSAPVSRLVVTSKALWLISSQGLHRNQSGLWMKISDQPANDVAEHLGQGPFPGSGGGDQLLRGQRPHQWCELLITGVQGVKDKVCF